MTSTDETSRHNHVDADDWRLLRAIRDCPHEWAARPDFQEAPIDLVRLLELARRGYITDVGERFLWKLTPTGRVALAYRTRTKEDVVSGDLSSLLSTQGDGAPLHEGRRDADRGDGSATPSVPHAQVKLWPDPEEVS